MLGNKHAFFGALFSPDQRKVLAYTYNGAMHIWKYDGKGIKGC
jgi:hypothetical protein